MQPLDQQSEELFDGETQTSDLVGSPACVAFWDITWALAVGVQSLVCLWKYRAQVKSHSLTCTCSENDLRGQPASQACKAFCEQ